MGRLGDERPGERDPRSAVCAVVRGALLAVTALVGATFAGCASSGVAPRPFPVPQESADTAQGRPGPSVVDTALSFQGTPYRAAGADPSGFDCSGLVQYVFWQHGVAMPRTVAEQFRAGRQVGDDRIQPGDLVFFRIGAGIVSHVGIAVGGGQFVHAPKERGTVRVESLAAPYWATRYAGARRMGRS